MYERQTRNWALGAGVGLTGILTLTLAAQPPVSQPSDAPLASTSLSTLQDSSGSKVSELTIGSWYFLGPYADGEAVQTAAAAANMRLGGLDYDYLATAGHPETQIDSSALAALCKAGDGCSKYASDGPIINLLKLFPGRPHTVLYAAAVLDSSVDGYVGLQYDISFGIKIWVNGDLVDESSLATRHPVRIDVHFVPLHVKKGTNVLLIKTNQEDLGPVFEPWGLVTGVMRIERMWDLMASTRDGMILANRLPKPRDPIHIPLLDAPMKLDRSAPITVSVMRADGSSVSKTPINRDDSGYIAVPKLDSGYYKVRLSVGTHTMDDAFYVGDPSAVHDALKAAQEKTPEQSDEFLQRSVILKRYEILTSQQYRMPEDANWQKKLMFVIEDAEASVSDQSKPAWYLHPGQHLREFISSTDQSHQNYLLDIPENPSKSMGLVIVVPYAVAKQRPFLESVFLTSATGLEQIRQASNDTDVAVAIIGARELAGGSPEDEADELDMLKDISNHYAIDPKRTYLYGVCEGGRNALLLAEHHPGIFAAVGAWGPTLAAARDENYDPVLQAKQIANTPLVLFKGDLDNELPNSALLAFGRILKSLGNQQVTIQIVPNTMHDPIRMEGVIFPLLARFTNGKATALTNDAEVKSATRIPPH